MDFWSQYYKESLGEPWVIQPEGQFDEEELIPEAPKQSVVFLTPPLEKPALKTMMERMVVAIKLNPEEVAFVEWSREDLSVLSEWEGSKKIMVFGKDFSPQNFGLVAKKAQHKIIVTHSLKDLKEKPELKKETWEHLKEFARLS